MFVYNMHIELMANATSVLVDNAVSSPEWGGPAFLGHSEGYYMAQGSDQDDITTLSSALRDGLDRHITYTLPDGSEVECITPAGSVGCAYIHREGVYSYSRAPSTSFDTDSAMWDGDMGAFMERLRSYALDDANWNQVVTPMLLLAFASRTANTYEDVTETIRHGEEAKHI
ncbi:hypothetical protein KIPB_006730 [Kipferlia bialata]|uniref:Uncharacterized protein n=1 Tax=Kipferlia bialata TaxID=797122 RepID=A0A9K3GJG5_9EUKA|nr:hypothetical protein KIPB_006730 [Kipferlia bialata]|eukprot:g6730.t1